jgi:hypothetical protein
MPHFDSLSFTITPADQVNVTGRAVRRIFLSNNALKLTKLSTGDAVVLVVASEISQQKVGVRLPSENEHAESRSYLEAVCCRNNMAVIRVSQ